MILFDYGHTLVYEHSFDAVKGTRAVMKYAVRNDNNLDAEEISRFSNQLFETIGSRARDYGVEVHNHMFQKLLYESLNIEFSLSHEDIELIFWDHAAPGEPMPHIEKVLAALKQKGIRSGVISNISFGGNSLARRINQLIPENDFEFILASSEYVFRKPDPLLFRLALKKAGLSPEEVWYCGDNTRFDVIGSSSVGIFPVWYHSEKDCFYRDINLDQKPDCDCLYIRDWQELARLVEKM